jgi:hypothetical protein
MNTHLSVQFVGYWNTDSGKEKHYESDSTPGLMELEGKENVDTNQERREDS